MKVPSLRSLLTAGVLAGASLAFAATSMGPPGLCGPIHAGADAQTLAGAYKDVKNDNVLPALTTLLDQFPDHATSRMEAIRRAVFATETKADRLERIALHLLARAACAEPKSQAAAIFDAGYFIYVCSVLADTELKTLGAADGIAGYALVKRAVALKDDPEMQVGACYVTFPPMHSHNDLTSKASLKAFREHAKLAARNLSDERISKNLEVLLPQDGVTLESLRSTTAR